MCSSDLPKTIGDASDEQLAMVKGKLEERLKTMPGDQVMAQRLKDVNDELEYRKTEKAPVTYDQWAALARKATTPEQQAKVLEYAKDVHMPVRGLQDLFTRNMQLAEEQALGTKTEKGLFPETERESEAKRAYLLASADEKLASGMRKRDLTPAELQVLEARERYYLAGAGLRGEQAEDLSALRPYKAGKMEEQIHDLHEHHLKLAAETNAINQKLGPQIDKIKAESAKLRALAAKARRGGAGGGLSADELKLIREYNDRGRERVQEADTVAKQAETNAERAVASAREARLRAELAERNVSEPEDVSRLYGPAKTAAMQRNLEREKIKATSDAAKAVADQLEATAQKTQDAANQARAVHQAALKAGDDDRGIADELAQKYLERRGVRPPSSTRTAPAAAPAAPAKPAAPTTGAPPKPANAPADAKLTTLRNGKQVWYVIGPDGKPRYL